MALRRGSPSAASPRCAISFHTWNEAPSGPTPVPPTLLARADEVIE
jgi:hypothetical protein